MPEGQERQDMHHMLILMLCKHQILGFFYQKQVLPPVDPLPMRNGLMSDFDYRGVDPELEYLHRQRVRERTMDVEMQRWRF